MLAKQFTAKAVRVTNGCNCGILAQIYFFVLKKKQIKGGGTPFVFHFIWDSPL
jgi:hypothetical protein